MTPDALRVPCPKCHASAGEQCRSRTGNPSPVAHPTREQAAALTMLDSRAPRHDDDLVNLSEAERVLGVRPGVLRAIDTRTREGATTAMPAPRIVGRSVRLWSMRELHTWWAAREHGGDGRTLRHEPLAP